MGFLQVHGITFSASVYNYEICKALIAKPLLQIEILALLELIWSCV